MLRASPIPVEIEREPFLDESLIAEATVVDTIAGFDIRLQLTRRGSWILENTTVAHRGRRVAIAAEFGEFRWLAAPVIQHPVSNGLLVFTPDATREEAESIVNGLNKVIQRTRSKTDY